MRTLWLVVVCAACSKSSSGGGDKKGSADAVPTTVTIDLEKNLSGDYDLSGYGVSGTLSISDQTLDLKVPAGTTAVLDGRPLTVDGTTLQGPFALGASAADLPLSSEIYEFDGMPTGKVTIALAITLPGDRHAELDLPFDELATNQAYLNLLASVQRGPVTFPGEPASTAPARTAVWVEILDNSRRIRGVLGGATKMTEVDLVGVATESMRTVPCPSQYTDGSNHYTVNRFVFDDDVHLFDRRTGKEVAANKVAGKVPKCTRTTTGDFYSKDNVAVITAWIQGQLAK